MGFFSRLMGKRAVLPELDFTPEPQTYIIDAAGLADTNTRNSATTSPRDNFEALKTIARFASQENLQMTAVFTGRPLREAAEGANYKNIRVRYADDTAAARRLILQLAGQGSGQRAVVLTSDKELESAVLNAGSDCMRLNTFKKAIDNREERERRPQRQQRPNRQRDEKKAATPPATDKSEEPNKDILDFIDPL
ncbi:MAG: NYN domain-containing protein [Lentisphaerae bacterium]|nr:NYN domain-containing protein [Lentisphaerota bacterium]